MTPRQIRNLCGVASQWLGGRVTDEEVEDLVQDALAKAVEHWPSKEDVTWDQHCGYHVITAARGRLFEIQRGEHTKEVAFDTLPVEDQEELLLKAENDRVGQNADEREDRYAACWKVLEQLSDSHRNVLLIVFGYGTNMKQYAEFTKRSYTTIRDRAQTAIRRFREKAKEMGYTNDSDLGVFARLAEVERTWNGKCLEQLSSPGVGGSTGTVRPPLVFYDTNQQPHHVSGQLRQRQRELAERCSRLRKERTHCPVVSSPTPVPGQIYSPL